MAGRPDAPPFVLVDKQRGALRLTALDEVARGRGLMVGQALSDARAIVPDLAVEPADPDADAALLVGLAEWCDRYTPLVALDAPDGLFLDITGCAHLFGGEAALLEDLAVRLRAQGLAARFGLADTAGAAWAVARFATRPLVAPGEQEAAIAPLPVGALRLAAETAAGLSRLGLKTVGQVLAQPRAPLTARFGVGLLLRLDRALGRLDEPISPRLPVPAFLAERRFNEPVSHIEDIRLTAISLAETLNRALETASEGARLLELQLFRIDGAVHRLAVGTSRPVRDPRLVGRLFATKLDSLDDEREVGFGFDLVRLSAVETQRDDPAQIRLDGRDGAEMAVHHLIDRLGARLGLDRVMRILPGESHIPERAAFAAPAAAVREAAADWRAVPGGAANLPLDRPLRLFVRPEPVQTMAEVPEGPPVRFRWRRTLYRVARSAGPERIAAEWWRAAEEVPTRDYFRVEDIEGRRFWLFREGLYDREPGEPRWFLHGLFA